MNIIKAVVFDMDGVLVDAKDWHYSALNLALNMFGYDISRSEHLSRFDGLPTRSKLELLSKERGLPRALHEFINELKQQYTMQMIQTRAKPTYAHEYALSRLRSEGYKLGLASNSIRHSVETIMEKTRLRDYFSVMLSNEDVAKPKPDPEMYLKAAALLSVRPQDCLVVEDNEKGVRAALDAGAHVLQVETVADVTFPNIRTAIDSKERRAA